VTTSRPSLAATSAAVKRPTRIITYGWGERYVDVLLTFTLPALLAPGNLPHVASEVPCELVVLTQRRYFSQFDRHPAIARIRELCPVRLVRLDDLIVSKDKYGMTLTYALHRAFSDLGPQMTEHWQIFLNADFILADGCLRTVIGYLGRGERIVASPSYCTIAEEVVPELRKHLDPATSALCISHRELAWLILQHRHTVIRGKTANQTAFHMRYADQFYWSVDDRTLLGYQMPVSIVGLWPQRHVAQPNSYWDFGLIWEYCPQADVCVIGDSDEFTMLELRDDSVAQDQIALGPLNKAEIAQRMVTWVTPYQQHFLEFPLTLHGGDLPPGIDDARGKLRSFVDEVISNAPPLPSHINHSQWNYHYAEFHKARRVSSRVRSWVRRKLSLAVVPIRQLVRYCFKTIAHHRRKVMFQAQQKVMLQAQQKVMLQAQQKAIELCKPIVRIGIDRYVRPAFRRLGVEIVKSTTLLDIYLRSQEATRLRTELALLKRQATDFRCVEAESLFTPERRHDYQTIQSRMFDLEPQFLTLYEQCNQYTTSSWEVLYALYKSIQYMVTNRIPGDVVQCGVLRGGSMKLVAHALLSLGDTHRTFFLYHTVSDLPDLGARMDPASNKTEDNRPKEAKWAYPAAGIRETVATSGYPMEKLKLVQGAVEQTLPGMIPDQIALLRLDGAWYSSIRHEIEHLYPRLSPQGILIIDGYGNDEARRAVDEYFSKIEKKPLLQRIHHACRLAIKPA
jgi:O-methyltransferase